MRIIITACLVCLLCVSTASATPRLRLSGPPIADSIPLIAMAQVAHEWEQNFEADFIAWHSPDMLRAMVAGQQVDAAIVTTAAASTLRNKGIDCRVVLLHEAPVWIVSTRSGPDTLESLKGTLVFPFGPGEMPELFLKASMPEGNRNIVTRHSGGALEAVNLLLAGKGDHAMLSEPIATIALQRAKALQDKGVPELVKRVDMSAAWERTFPGHRLAASCVALFGQYADSNATASSFHAAYIEACRWVREHPAESIQLVAKTFPGLAQQMKNDASHEVTIRVLDSDDAYRDALFFLERIYSLSPAAVGGSMPGEELFWKPQ